jgi:hypothetical protein
MRGKRYLLIILILLANACKLIGNTLIKPIMEVAFIPLTNHDLLNLQFSLLHYKQTNNTWPGNVEDLIETNQKDSMDVEFDKFKSLQWNSIGDSLVVNYKLQYDYADTIQYKYLSGTFLLLSRADSVYSSHIEMKGERKDGTMRFESHAERKKQRVKK